MRRPQVKGIKLQRRLTPLAGKMQEIRRENRAVAAMAAGRKVNQRSSFAPAKSRIARAGTNSRHRRPAGTPFSALARRSRIFSPIFWRRRWLCRDSTDARHRRFWKPPRKRIACGGCWRASSSRRRFAARPSAHRSSGPARPPPAFFRSAQTRSQAKPATKFCNGFIFLQSTPACPPAADRTTASNPRPRGECSRTKPVRRWFSGRRCRGCRCSARVNPHWCPG